LIKSLIHEIKKHKNFYNFLQVHIDEIDFFLKELLEFLRNRWYNL